MTKSTGKGRGAGAGAPTKYREEFAAKAEKICQLGATEPEIAEILGINQATLTRWKHTHPKFCAAIKVGKAPADDRVEVSLFRRATGYTFETEEIFQVNGRIIRAKTMKHVPPDTTAMIFWLKNRKKLEWRDRHETQLSTPIGQPLEVAAHNLPSTPDLIGDYFRRLEQARTPARRDTRAAEDLGLDGSAADEAGDP